MKNILLIEDNDIIRENIAELLEIAGYTLQTAENGKNGIDKALQSKPDLVICDIKMPVLDGYGVLSFFRENSRLTGVPFIFLTAKTDRSDFRKGMELGADDYLTKPFKEAELLKAVESRINRFNAMKNEYSHDSNGLQAFLADARQKTDSLKKLSTDLKVHSFPKKQFVYFEGEEATRLYFLRKGIVKTVRTDSNGKEFITGLYQSGEYFGYLPLLEGKAHTESALTLENSELIIISGKEVNQLILTNPQVSLQFIKLLAGRAAEREEQLIKMAYSSLRRRVADTLLHLYDQKPDVVIQFSRADLAAMVGTATESLIRTLAEFKQDGLVEITPTGGIRVLQPSQMRNAHW